MVHFEYTVTTLSTVVSSLWFPCLFANALIAVHRFTIVTWEWSLHAFDNAAWISEHASKIGNDLDNIESIADAKVNKAIMAQWNTCTDKR